jgi:hypothetical protein
LVAPTLTSSFGVAQPFRAGLSGGHERITSIPTLPV